MRTRFDPRLFGDQLGISQSEMAAEILEHEAYRERFEERNTNMSERVTVTVEPGGEVKVEAHGIKGSGCEALTKPMLDALGEAGDSELKPEYYESEAAAQQQSQG